MSRSRQLSKLASVYDAGGPLGYRNRIINGDMRIDQRNAGAAQNSLAGSTAVYLVDRWYYYGTQAGKFNSQQNAGSVTPPSGFTNYLGLTSTSAYSSVSSDIFNLRQAIEGLNVADLGWGTSNAKTVTLSFQVYSSITGMFSGVLSNTSYTRCYPFSFTVTAANTWTTISITIAGDTTGTWATNNTAGLIVTFNLGSGSSLLGTAGAWTGTTLVGVTGSVSIVGTNGATFYITGVQLEVGSTATSFDVRDYGRELIMCQRYYQVLGNSGTIWTGDGNVYRVNCTLPVTMRAAATATVTVNSASANFLNNGSYPNVGTSTDSYQLNVANNLGGPAAIINWNVTIKLPAEL